MRKLTFIPVLILAVLVAGCDSLFETGETLWEGRVVEFQPRYLGAAAHYNATLSFAHDGTGTQDHTMVVQLVAAQEPNDNTVTFRIVGDESSAVEGTHYEFVTTGGQTTIPANSSFGNITVRALGAGLEPGQSRNLVVELTADGTVPPSENYKRFTLFFAKAAS